MNNKAEALLESLRLVAFTLFKIAHTKRVRLKLPDIIHFTYLAYASSCVAP
jgi:hypothetical protein